MDNINQEDEFGRMIGKWIHYYPNGQINSIENFIKGEIWRGEYIAFHDNGNIAYKDVYHIDEIINYSQDFEPNGRLIYDNFIHQIF
jgi:antitoxin component YwqK of YwqJK toxin-antitoxin module